MPYELTQEQRDRYRAISIRAQKRKQDFLRNPTPKAEPAFVNRLDMRDLMPQVEPHGLTCLSLFSGGGGLDLGFERAGYEHWASFELLEVCGETLRLNRPDWTVFSGDDGDVTKAKFSRFRGVDVVHGGPPCQPFSVAGKQQGAQDPRNMWKEFVRCVTAARPRAFVAENVVGLLDKKFDSFVRRVITGPLEREGYTIFKFRLAAHDFGVPQARRRVFFVGFRAERDAARFVEPQPTHGDVDTIFGPVLPRNTARRSLGLPAIGFDDVSPTLRSGFTGPRKTTGVVNSKASLKTWNDLRIWPNGVQPTHDLAVAYPPENGHFRLSVEDCALLQGFPEDWKFSGAVYQVLGQIGNSVCPPVAYSVANAVTRALGKV